MDGAHMELVGRVAERQRWNPELCPIDRTLRCVGTRSAMLLLREAFYGTTRFDDFVARVGVTEAVAATRLKELVEIGMLQRRPYREPGQRTRYEYVLTDAGTDFLPALLALMQWGDRYLSEASGPPLLLRHRDCGEPVSVHVECDAGHAVPLEEMELHSARRRPSRPAV
jgi:DNA-binding HxlR family transcriptional regulator